MIGNNLWPDEARNQLLHILPQEIYHGDAQIRGSNAALKRLGEALIKASKTGQGTRSEVGMMASDGEGYRVLIYPMSDQQMESGPMPYSTQGLSWEHERCHDCPHDIAQGEADQ
jgi:hypothetical protein